MLSLFVFVGLTRWVWGFECSDGCVIGDQYLSDHWCDCFDCEDESEYTCETCFFGCPESCGDFTFCASMAACKDGCMFNATLLDDGSCDCSECVDEQQWTCGTCPYCPQTCGESVVCTGGSTTPEPTSFYTCNDGCDIPSRYVADGWCDCSQCDEEPSVTCATCPGCPTFCGGYVACTGLPPTTEKPTTEEPTEAGTTEVTTYTCDDGCEIDASYVNDDDFCDCSDCGDEDSFTCASCGGCPDTCGAYVDCSAATTERPQTTRTDAAASAHLLLPALMSLLYALYSL